MSTEMRTYVIHLLETYLSVQQRIAVLRYELANPSCVHPDEVLEALAYSNHSDGTRPSRGHVSDKTFYIAMNYQKQTENLNRENISAVSAQLIKLERSTARLEYYVAQLDTAQNATVRGLYFEGKSLKVMASELHISERTVQRYRDSGLPLWRKCTRPCGTQGSI